MTALTDAAGAVQERYAYDAYGNILFLSAAGNPLATQASTVANPFTFTGRRYDDETGLYYYRARYYDAQLGRFIGRDPIRYGGGLNLYAYIGSSPTGATDPMGLVVWWNLGGHLGNWLAGQVMRHAADSTRLGHWHYEVETQSKGGCAKIMIGFAVQRKASLDESYNPDTWLRKGEIWSTHVYDADKLTLADVDEKRKFLEDIAKSKAVQASVHKLIDWMEFLADMAPCGQFLREGLLENKVTASGTLWCGFDIITAGFGSKIVSASGKLVAGTAKGVGRYGDDAFRVMCRMCNCFEEGTLVLGPNQDREIQHVHVGQRVLTHARQKRSSDSHGANSGDRLSADDDEDDPDDADDLKIDPQQWRKITIVMRRAGGSRSDIVLLRPAIWLNDLDATTESRVWLDMPEMSCQGWAEVIAIEACPPIESTGGRIVTGIFHHSHGQLLDIHVQGVEKPIGATAAHPFWSEDRQDFVSVGQLRQGERLRTLEGLAQIEAIRPRGPPQAVYNIEVSVDHTYLVTEDGVLVHNTSACRTITGKLSDAASNLWRSRARRLWERLQGYRASSRNLEVHHRIPLEWSHLIPNANPNRVANLVGLPVAVHHQMTAAWNAWRRGLGGEPLQPQR